MSGAGVNDYRTLMVLKSYELRSGAQILLTPNSNPDLVYISGKRREQAYIAPPLPVLTNENLPSSRLESSSASEIYMHATPSKPLPSQVGIHQIESRLRDLRAKYNLLPIPSCERLMLQNEPTKKPRCDLRRHVCARYYVMNLATEGTWTASVPKFKS